MTEREPRSSIQVIDRMMDLLDAMARQPSPTGLKQLASEARLHPSTAHRILSVMTRNRMVERARPGTYRLGMRLLELGNLVRLRIGVRREALPYMRQLQRQLGETVDLSMRHDDDVIYIERACASGESMHASEIVGRRAPLHTTAVGKIFLAADGSEKNIEYAERTGLPKCTDNSLTDPSVLIGELEAARRVGYAFDNEEAEKGVSCVGAGIYDGAGRLVAGLSVSAPTERFNRGWAAHVRQATERISWALGNNP